MDLNAGELKLLHEALLTHKESLTEAIGIVFNLKRTTEDDIIEKISVRLAEINVLRDKVKVELFAALVRERPGRE